MQKSLRCTKCDSNKIGHLDFLVDQGHTGWSARKIAETRGDMGWADVAEKVGQIEAYVCTECGYFEEYVQGAAEVPWDQLKGFEWCNE